MKYCCSARPTAGPFDFHTHTCYSDGAPDQTPRTVCRLAKTEGGLAHLALTSADIGCPRRTPGFRKFSGTTRPRTTRAM